MSSFAALASALAVGVIAGCTSDTFTAGDGGDAAAACPDEHGEYSVAFTGAGCKVATGPNVCVAQTGCSLTIGVGASIGSVTVDATGSFDGAQIQQGPDTRTGCTGTWGGSGIAIDCGGTGTSQSCVATLTRTSLTCN